MRYSPISPGGSPGPSIFDDDSIAGIVDYEESDFRDIVMLYQVKERVAARQQGFVHSRRLEGHNMAKACGDICVRVFVFVCIGTCLFILSYIESYIYIH